MEVVVIATWAIMFIASIVNSGTATTTVVLADNGKEQNAIVIQTDVGETTIDKVGQYVNLSSKNEAPSEIKTMSQKEIDKKFKSAIEATTLKPININL